MTTDVSLSSYLPDSVFRSPAWCWLYAQQLVQSCKRSRHRYKDVWVDRATKYLRGLDHQEERTSGRRRGRFDLAIECARNIFDDVESRQRWILESLLLTLLPVDRIAERLNMPIEVIEAYEALFFEVRSRPRASDWIAINAIGAGPWNNYGGGRLEPLWKSFAYAGGERALDVVVAATGYLAWPRWLVEACGTDSAPILKRLRVKVLLIIKMMTAGSDKEVRALIRMHERVDALSRGGRKAESGMVPMTEYFLGLAHKKKGRSKTLTITLDHPVKSKKKALPKAPSSIRG
jgi:hypothetical protein